MQVRRKNQPTSVQEIEVCKRVEFRMGIFIRIKQTYPTWTHFPPKALSTALPTPGSYSYELTVTTPWALWIINAWRCSERRIAGGASGELPIWGSEDDVKQYYIRKWWLKYIQRSSTSKTRWDLEVNRRRDRHTIIHWWSSSKAY